MDKQKITPLVIKAQKGDKNALQELFASCYDSLYYFAYKTTKSEDLAADITQESCIEIMRSLDKLKDPNAFSTWAHQITYHQCTKHFRVTKEVLLEENEDGETILDILPDESDDALPEQVIEDKELQNTLQNILNELPAEQRSAMLLYYYENLSVKQIAQIHGTGEGTVKSRLNYGRKAVKNQVEAYEKKNGVKLHSIAPLPLLLYFLFKQGKESASAAAASAMPAVSSAVNSAVNSSVLSSAVSAGAATAKSVGTATAKSVGTSIVTKILMSAAAVALVATVAVGTVHIAKNSSKNQSSGSVADNQTNNGSISDNIGHTHQYSWWEFDKDNHWQACECGEKTAAEAHNNIERECTVCGRLYESEGLTFEVVDDHAVLVDIGRNRDSEVVIPSEYEGKPVTEIGENVFSNSSNIKNVIIPNTVTAIGDKAFFRCYGLVNVTIPDSVTEIGDYAFDSCQSLESISLPNSITTIGQSAFSGCDKLAVVTLPNMLTRIENFVFQDCESLVSLTLPDSVTSIGTAAFFGCENLEQINIPDSVVEVNGSAFYRCDKLIQTENGVNYVGNIAVDNVGGVVDVTLRNGTRLIAGGAFDSINTINNIDIPNTVTGIGNQAFYRSSLKSITIPDSVTSIGMRAFESCSMLESITLPGSITSIGEYAFNGCYYLKTITFDGTEAQWNTIEKSENKFDNFTNAKIVFAK